MKFGRRVCCLSSFRVGKKHQRQMSDGDWIVYEIMLQVSDGLCWCFWSTLLIICFPNLLNCSRSMLSFSSKRWQFVKMCSQDVNIYGLRAIHFFFSLSLYNQNHQERRHCFSFSNLTICCFLWSHCECQKIWAFFSQKIKKYVTDYTVAWPWVDESAGLLKGGLMPVITERKKTWYLLDMRMKSICGVAHL